MPAITAVVLNWNGPDDTIQCVRSLQDCGYPGLNIVVVDNASTDDSVVRFQSELPDVQLISRASNGGYGAGNNEGIKYALARGADYVLVINNDVVVTRGFLDPLLAEAEADSGVGIVTCDARFQSDVSRSYPTGGSISRVRGAGVSLPERRRGDRTLVNFVSGCILLVRRQVFEKVGLFDESFFMYFEDVEFSRRVSSAFQMVYTPLATVYHRSGGGDAWSRQTPTYLYYMGRNRVVAFRNRPRSYRAYLALVSFGAAITKSMAILGRGRKKGQQLRALWSGVIAGTRYIPGRSAGAKAEAVELQPRP